jgi:hypothetical protein
MQALITTFNNTRAELSWFVASLCASAILSMADRPAAPIGRWVSSDQNAPFRDSQNSRLNRTPRPSLMFPVLRLGALDRLLSTRLDGMFHVNGFLRGSAFSHL